MSNKLSAILDTCLEKEDLAKTIEPLIMSRALMVKITLDEIKKWRGWGKTREIQNPLNSK